jgi:hypothetical protein
MWRILGVGAVVHFCRLPDFVETEIEGSGFRVGAGFDRGFLRVDGETRMMGVVGVFVGGIDGSGFLQMVGTSLAG